MTNQPHNALYFSSDAALTNSVTGDAEISTNAGERAGEDLEGLESPAERCNRNGPRAVKNITEVCRPHLRDVCVLMRNARLNSSISLERRRE